MPVRKTIAPKTETKPVDRPSAYDLETDPDYQRVKSMNRKELEAFLRDEMKLDPKQVELKLEKLLDSGRG